MPEPSTQAQGGLVAVLSICTTLERNTPWT